MQHEGPPDARRLFVALFPPEPVAQSAAGAVDELLGGQRGLRLVPWSELHLTLCFLGAVEASRIEPLQCELERALAGAAAAELEIASAGRFPERGPPRVWWLGIRDLAASLPDLRRRCAAAALRAGAGEQLDAGRRAGEGIFHLTVARTRERARPVARELEARFLALSVREGWRAREVLLCESQLGRRAGRYVVRLAVQLEESQGRG